MQVHHQRGTPSRSSTLKGIHPQRGTPSHTSERKGKAAGTQAVTTPQSVPHRRAQKQSGKHTRAASAKAKKAKQSHKRVQKQSGRHKGSERKGKKGQAATQASAKAKRQAHKGSERKSKNAKQSQECKVYHLLLFYCSRLFRF